jgi:hypothetical protein
VDRPDQGAVRLQWLWADIPEFTPRLKTKQEEGARSAVMLYLLISIASRTSESTRLGLRSLTSAARHSTAKKILEDGGMDFSYRPRLTALHGV